MVRINDALVMLDATIAHAARDVELAETDLVASTCPLTPADILNLEQFILATGDACWIVNKRRWYQDLLAQAENAKAAARAAFVKETDRVAEAARRGELITGTLASLKEAVAATEYEPGRISRLHGFWMEAMKDEFDQKLIERAAAREALRAYSSVDVFLDALDDAIHSDTCEWREPQGKALLDQKAKQIEDGIN